MSKFWEGLGGKLAERWVSAILTPAFGFWAGGLLAWAWAHGGIAALQQLATTFAAHPPVIQGAIVVSAFLWLSVSAWIGEQLAMRVIRLLEGYWPRWLRPVRERMIARLAARAEQAEQRWQELAGIRPDRLSGAEADEYIMLDAELRRFPVTPAARMPTRLGNVLRAAEAQPGAKYGLDTVQCWPRLWLLLPADTRSEVSAARGVLDQLAVAWLWGAFFVVWTPWAWWAPLVSLVVTWTTYKWMLDAALVYGDLLESSFDLYRASLYASLGLAAPRNAATERARGAVLTAYLLRGTDRALRLTFSHDK